MRSTWHETLGWNRNFKELELNYDTTAITNQAATSEITNRDSLTRSLLRMNKTMTNSC